MNRQEIFDKLRGRANQGNALLAVGAGTGLVAAAAERGGADLIVVYNTGSFRSHGQPSLAGLMPYGDANATVLEMGERILPAVKQTPVLAGVCATDPYRAMRPLLTRLGDMGFAGVQNFPTVDLIDGTFRADLEASGISFAREVEMISLAHELGLFTCAFVCDVESAAAMAQAGADVIAPHLGVTRPGEDPARAAERIQEMRNAAVAIRPDALVLFHGGPSHDPVEVQFLLSATRGVAGYFAASSVERTPVEQAVQQATYAFRSLDSDPDGRGDDALAPSELLDVDTLPGYLVRNGLVPDGVAVDVANLGGGISNALMLYRSGDDRGVVKQSRPRIRVEEEWFCDVRRVLAERDAIDALGSRLPAGSVPKVRFSDDDNFTFVMDAADEDARLWKTELLAGRVDPGLGRTAGSLLASIHSTTAGDEDLRRRFATDMLSQLRIDPYYMTTARRHPYVLDHFEHAVRQLLSERHAMVHGDFVPKNMLVLPDGGLLLLDYEIAHYGNPAYDVASFVNHLTLKVHTVRDHASDLIATIRAFFTTYSSLAGPVAPTDEAVLLQLGCLMLARVDGKSPVEYLPDETLKDEVRSLAAAVLHGEFTTVDAVIDDLETRLAPRAKETVTS